MASRHHRPINLPAPYLRRVWQWAMTVNERWRICFKFQKGDAHEVEIVDYHKG